MKISISILLGVFIGLSLVNLMFYNYEAINRSITQFFTLFTLWLVSKIIG